MERGRLTQSIHLIIITQKISFSPGGSILLMEPLNRWIIAEGLKLKEKLHPPDTITRTLQPNRKIQKPN